MCGAYQSQNHAAPSLPKTCPPVSWLRCGPSPDLPQPAPWRIPSPGMSPACQGPASLTEPSLLDLQTQAFHGTWISDGFVCVPRVSCSPPHDEGIQPPLPELSWLTSGHRKQFLICGCAAEGTGQGRPLLPLPKSAFPAIVGFSPTLN